MIIYDDSPHQNWQHVPKLCTCSTTVELPGASHLPFSHPLPPTEERPADSLRYWSWLHLPRDLGSEHQGGYHLGYALDMLLRPKDKSTGVPHVGLTTGIRELPSGKLTSLCIPNSYVKSLPEGMPNYFSKPISHKPWHDSILVSLMSS